MTLATELDELLARHGIDRETEEPFPNDGWSGATLTRLRDRNGESFILKRSHRDRDWIGRATRDEVGRERIVAVEHDRLPAPVRYPALGAASDRDETAILMRDLSDVLFDWDGRITVDQLDVVLAAMTALHEETGAAFSRQAMWTPWHQRVTLICRSSLERPGPAHDAVADRILPGWAAWDRVATAGARGVVAALDDDVQPLLDALAGPPSGLVHGDLKLANVGIAPDGGVELVDWQMVTVAPAAMELGWFLVSNVNALPLPPDAVLERYWRIRDREPGGEDDLAILVGLLLRGWRKGYDAEAGITLGSGVTAADDLAWWCERAVEAADRAL